MTGLFETEVKIAAQDPDAVRDLLRSRGFREAVSRRLEVNTLYDTPEARLRENSMLLRLREVGGDCIVTWKGPGRLSAHKSRPEIETSAGSAERLGRILEEIGFLPTFRYEKFRTEYKASPDAPGVVTLDETPIGTFLELEGPGDWIDHTAAELGFTSADYILESYGRLYIADCQRRGIEPGNMIFPS
ncbi:MAG: class IV adenylate cyclase [Bryobacteraceae bacterium]